MLWKPATKRLGFLFSAIFLFLVQNHALAASLEHIRVAYHPDKIRAVLDFNDDFKYEAEQGNDRITILLKNVSAGPEIFNYVELDDLAVRYFQVEKEGDNLKVTIPLHEPVGYNLFPLRYPPRLVIDFDRNYLRILFNTKINPGIEFLKLKRGTAQGRAYACALKVDLEQAEVIPAMPPKKKPGLIESFFDFFAQWGQKKQEATGFSLDKVGNIAAQNKALAAVNGTYFASSGRPLGALMIDHELISYSIYDRTAFFLDGKDRPYIDNIFASSYFELENGVRFKINGINQPRQKDDLVLYTPAWGESTKSNKYGIEFTVVNSKITAINLENSKIPDNGYVLSASGPKIQFMAEMLKRGAPIDTRIKIVPYSTSPRSIKHLVSGGPRLVKKGQVYISKHEEKFKPDIAKRRAARTAVGITEDNKLLLVTVDGKQKGEKNNPPKSSGVTLEELAEIMLSLGAFEAMNLDGGSSSTMIIAGKTVNRPVATYQRRVSNAILIKPKPSSGLGKI